MNTIDLAIEHRTMIRVVIENEDYANEEERLELISEYNDLAEELDFETWEDG